MKGKGKKQNKTGSMEVPEATWPSGNPGRPLKVKICGLMQPGNVEEVCALDPDFMGYIFVPGSPRYVGEAPDPALFRIPGAGSARVGVFVDEPVTRVRKLFESCPLDLVQLHGSESPAYCRELTDAGIPLIKAIHAGGKGKALLRDTGAARIRSGGTNLPSDFVGVVHYLLFDSGSSGSGGSGIPFDWSLLGQMDISLPFLLGGGIGPEDAERVRRLGHPALSGVDLNSRFELSPGIKDVKLLKPFIDAIRKPLN